MQSPKDYIAGLITDFLKSRRRNAWIVDAEGIHVYVRRSKRSVDNQLHACFDVASIDNNDPHLKLVPCLLSVLPEICNSHDIKYFIFENVMPPELKQFLLNHGGSIYFDDPYADCATIIFHTQ